MTYIYIDTTSGTHAVIAADTWAYTFGVRHMSISDKCRVYPMRRLAILSQGDTLFAARWAAAVEALGSDSATLDALNELAGPLLRTMWEDEHRNRPGEQISDSLIFHVGWSTTEGRFVLYVLDSRHDFEPEHYDGVFVHPTPIGYRFGPNELERAEKDLAEVLPQVDAEHAAAHEQNMEAARSGDLEVPSFTADEDLVAFAEFVRRNRSLRAVDTMHHVLVGGSLYATVLTQDAVRTARLHTFPDDPGVFAGTLHPSAQLGACWCDSGDRWIDCHGALELDEPCRCASDTVFRDCCAITAPAAARVAAR